MAFNRVQEVVMWIEYRFKHIKNKRNENKITDYLSPDCICANLRM